MLLWAKAQGFGLNYPHWLSTHLYSKAFSSRPFLSAFLGSYRLCYFTSGPYFTLFIITR